MSADLACPVCGSELDLAVLFSHEHDQRALARLADVSIPIGARVLQYLALFTPPRQRLTAAKKIKLILQLLPDLERQAVTHKGREWPAPLAAWAAGIDQMLAARDAARLDLPMKGHGYLYAILAGMADKHEAQAEEAGLLVLRSGPRPAAAHGPARIADVVLQAAPGRPPRPALAPQAAVAAGTSPTVRAMRAALAAKAAAHPTEDETP